VRNPVIQQLKAVMQKLNGGAQYNKPRRGVYERLGKRSSERDFQTVLELTTWLYLRGLSKVASTANGRNDIVRWRAGRRWITAKQVVAGIAVVEAGPFEVCVVEDVERVHTELDPEAFLNEPVLCELEVKVSAMRTKASAARSRIGRYCANGITGQRERRWIPDLLSAEISGIATYAGNQRPIVLIESCADKRV
jgi:hypothetical protein